MKIEEIAKRGGFEKRNNKWWNEFYLEMLDVTPYQLGDSVSVDFSNLKKDTMLYLGLPEIYFTATIKNAQDKNLGKIFIHTFELNKEKLKIAKALDKSDPNQYDGT